MAALKYQRNTGIHQSKYSTYILADLKKFARIRSRNEPKKLDFDGVQIHSHPAVYAIQYAVLQIIMDTYEGKFKTEEMFWQFRVFWSMLSSLLNSGLVTKILINEDMTDEIELKKFFAYFIMESVDHEFKNFKTLADEIHDKENPGIMVYAVEQVYTWFSRIFQVAKTSKWVCTILGTEYYISSNGKLNTSFLKENVCLVCYILFVQGFFCFVNLMFVIHRISICLYRSGF